MKIYRSCALGHNYSDLASIGPLLLDNVCTDYVHIQSRGRTGSGPFPQRVPRRSNERARHPSAMNLIETYVLIHALRSEGDGKGRYLVVKTTMAIEVVEICRVSLAAPKVHIRNLKIAPNCVLIDLLFQGRED